MSVVGRYDLKIGTPQSAAHDVPHRNNGVFTSRRWRSGQGQMKRLSGTRTLLQATLTADSCNRLERAIAGTVGCER